MIKFETIKYPYTKKFKFKKITPKNIFLDESKPAAYKRAIFVLFLSHIIRQANLEIVLAEGPFLLSTLDKSLTLVIFLSAFVSITTKSIGVSDDRPT